MYWNTNLRSIGLVLSVLLLAGCANNQTKPAESAAATPTESAAAANNAAAANAQARSVALPPAVVPNPSVIQFDKMSTALDDKGRLTIAQLADRARISQKLSITAFCDRRQIGNPNDAAAARAIAVRDEVLALGVVPGNIRVKLNTTVAKKHAVEIHFD